MGTESPVGLPLWEFVCSLPRTQDICHLPSTIFGWSLRGTLFPGEVLQLTSNKQL